MRCLIILSLIAHWLSPATAHYATYFAPGSAPQPVQVGYDQKCTQWAQAQPGDTCYMVTQKLPMAMADFLHMNPQLRDDCQHNLWAGYWYCFGYEPASTTVGPPPFTVRPPPSVTGTSLGGGASFKPITGTALGGASFTPITVWPTSTTKAFVKGTRPPSVLEVVAARCDGGDECDKVV